MIGIYKITNLVNNKVYIGQSWNIDYRWLQHRACKKNTHNAHLQSALLLYGLENFSFEVLREFQESPLTQIFLDTFENYYAKLFESHNPNKGYNIRECGSRGRQSEETKKKLSELNKGRKLDEATKKKIGDSERGHPVSEETRKKISAGHKGKPRSEETKKKLSDINKGKVAWNKGKVMSEETKRKISASRKRMFAERRKDND